MTNPRDVIARASRQGWSDDLAERLLRAKSDPTLPATPTPEAIEAMARALDAVIGDEIDSLSIEMGAGAEVSVSYKREMLEAAAAATFAALHRHLMGK